MDTTSRAARQSVPEAEIGTSNPLVTAHSLSLWIVVVAALVLSSCVSEPRWWKGNLHTHSYWSDGDDYPEMIVDWYRQNGYHFVALSDHNVLAEGDRWINLSEVAGARAVHRRYVDRFGTDWVSQRVEAGDTLVRLKTYQEYRKLLEQSGAFLTIQAEEIDDRFEGKPIHLNATNVESVIEPQGGSSVRDVMQNNIDAVLDQRRRTGRPIMPHLNHPNYRWAVTAEDIAELEGERFFEIYNGHPLVNNEGDSVHVSTEEMWDIVLATRLRSGRPVMYGLAVDDAHHYREDDSTRANPGRGWVMVRAAELTASAIIAALEAGDFYGSTGVVLDDIRWDGRRLEIDIRLEEGVDYETRFIGARSGAASDADLLLASVAGSHPAYAARGDELYVRAKVVSTKRKTNGVGSREMEVAWTQPITPDKTSGE